MSDVIERFAHRTDEAFVFVEQAVKQPHQIVQLAVGFADRNAGLESPGANNGAGSSHNLSNRLHGAMRDERACVVLIVAKNGTGSEGA